MFLSVYATLPLDLYSEAFFVRFYVMPPHVQKKHGRKAERHDSHLSRHAGNLRLTAVLLHPRLRNEAISSREENYANGQLTTDGHRLRLFLAFPLLSFTARFASGTLSLPTLLHVSASPRPPFELPAAAEEVAWYWHTATPSTANLPTCHLDVLMLCRRRERVDY